MATRKINYFYVNEGAGDSGVTKKVIGQLHALQMLNIPCALFTNKAPGMRYENISEIHQFSLPGINKKKDALEYFRTRANEMGRILSTLNGNDILYIRGVPSTPWDLQVLKRPRRCAVVCEIQSISLKERPLCISTILERIVTRPIRRHINAFVTVTDEIRRYEQRLFPSFTPSICLPNGFGEDSFSFKPPSLKKKDSIHMISVARFNKCHGVERLLPMLKSTKFDLTLDLVGEGPGLHSIRKYAESVGVTNQCNFHGKKQGEELDYLFNQAEIAIGVLAIHHKGLKESSALKHREYCARGIPFIFAGRDPDFPASFHYAKRIALNDNPILVNDLIDFFHFIRNHPEHPKKMRAYARKHLTWSSKMRKLQSFLDAF